MSSTNLIPVFTPEGNLAKVPAENLSEAMKPENGFKMAVSVTSPEGNPAWVPNDKAHDALAQGFKIGPPAQNPANHMGGPDLGSMWNVAKEAGKDLTGAVGGMADMFSGSQVTAPLKLGAEMAQGHIQAYQDAKDAAQHGNIPKAMFKSVAAGVPIAGPMASDIYDDAEAGNNERAVGKGLSRVLQVAAPEFAPKALPALADATEGLRNTAADTLNESAQKSLGKVLAPTKQATKFIAKEKVIPGMQERGITAASSKSLQDRAAANVEDIGQKIDDAYDAQPVQPSIPTKPIIDRLEAYKKNFTNEVPALGNQPAKTVVLDPAAIERISQVQDLIAQHGESLDPQSLRTLRQHFDENVAAGKGYAGKTMAEGHSLEVQKQAANAIRGQLADAVPGLSDLNSEFSFWKNLHDVMEQTAQRRTGQQGGGLGRKIATGTGTAVGAHLGGPAGALIGAEAGNFLSRLTNSTAWNTISAKLKTGLADALATKDPAAINQAVSNIRDAAPTQAAEAPLPHTEATPSGETPQSAPQTLPAFLRRSQQPVEATPAQTPAPRPSFLNRRQPQNAAIRQKVADMSPEDRATALLTSEKTGLPNYRAFQEAPENSASHVGYADLDNFKSYNDALSHKGVDTAVLPAIGDMFKEAANKHGVQVFHRSGDEFLFRSSDPQAIHNAVGDVNQQLANTVFEYQTPDGKILTKKGTGLSHGIGQDEHTAELSAQEDKQIRASQGLRSERETVSGLDPRSATGEPSSASDNTGRQGIPGRASDADQENPVTPPEQIDLNAPKSKRKIPPDATAKADTSGKIVGMKADDTSSPEFKSWFSGSKVADSAGKPLTVYHGTNEPFDRVDMSKGAQGTFWLTTDRAAIERGESGATSNAHVLQAHVSIKNPAGWDEYEKKSIDELIRDGYDGVILPEGGHSNIIAFEPDQVRIIKRADSPR